MCPVHHFPLLCRLRTSASKIFFLTGRKEKKLFHDIRSIDVIETGYKSRNTYHRDLEKNREVKLRNIEFERTSFIYSLRSVETAKNIGKENYLKGVFTVGGFSPKQVSFQNKQ